MSKPSNANEQCVGPSAKNAGKASTCDGCPNQQDCSSGKYQKTKEQLQTNKEIASRLESVKNILLVLSGKGGVGKSTIASQIAYTFSHWNLKVGILDIDICGPSIARMMGVENEEVHRSGDGWEPVFVNNNLGVMSVAFMLPNKNDAIIWRGPRKTGLIKQFLTDVSWNELDYLIIDCPPGTSDEHISIASFIINCQKYNKNIKLNSLIVTTPQEISLLDVRKEISFCNKVKLNILGVVENMKYFVCNCCGKKQKIFYANTGGGEKLCKEYGIEYLSGIPMDSNLLRITEKGKGYVKWSKKYGYKNNKNKKKNVGTRVSLIKLCSQILKLQYIEKYNKLKNQINGDSFKYYDNEYDSNDEYNELTSDDDDDNDENENSEKEEDNDIEINKNDKELSKITKDDDEDDNEFMYALD